MSADRWAASALIIAFLVTLLVAAIPEPRPSAQLNPRAETASLLTNSLDRLQDSVALVHGWLYRLTSPVRSAVHSFTGTGIGGGQQWYMFSNPYVIDQYIRVDTYVQSIAQPRRVRRFRQLLLPAHHEDRLRVVHHYRDKAILVLLEKYSQAVARLADPRDSPELRQTFEPITRYSRKRLAPYLAADERVSRSEMWFGAASIPPPGATDDPALVRARLASMEPYHDRPIEIALSGSPARLGSAATEIDLRWTLIYVDPPDAFTAQARQP